MPDVDAEYLALEIGSEDWCGLWELLWYLNTKMTDVAFDERARIAATALRRLNDAGHLKFSRAPWPHSKPGGSVTREELDAELDSQGWRQVPPVCDIWFTNTEEGDSEYQARAAVLFASHPPIR